MALTLLVLAWLLTYLVHSTLLLGGAWVLTVTRLVRSPAARDALWKVCLVGGMVTATVYSLSPYQPYAAHVLLPSAAASAPAAVAPVAAPAVPAPAAEAGARPVAGRPVLRTERSSAAPPEAAAAAPPAAYHLPPATWPQVLLGAWLLGAVALLARLLLVRRRLRRSLSRRRDIEDGALTAMLDSLRALAGVRLRPRLTASAELAGPVAIGVSEICLPERALTALDPAQQRAVLAHELGHLVRRDPVWLGLAAALEGVFFFQPLNALARRRIQEAAEYLCDDWAVRQTGGSLTLAKCLAEVATWMDAGRRAVPVAGMAENRSQLVDRVHRLLEGVQPARKGVRLAVPLAALALSSMAFAAPGVSPPCDQAAALGPAAPSVPAVWQGPDVTWATIRDGRVLKFRDGFAPRLTGQGHLGIRRGGRMIELAEGQRLLVNGREPNEDAIVEVSSSDSVRIVDADGRTLWRIAPVRVPTAAAAGEDDAETRAAPARAWNGGDSLDERLDTLDDDLAGLDAADAAEIARSAAEISRNAGEIARSATDIGAEVSTGVVASIMPQVAQLQEMGMRLGSVLAPRMAGISAKIVSEVVPQILQGLCDGGLCDDSTPPVKRHKVYKPRP